MEILNSANFRISRITERTGPVRTAEVMFPLATPEAVERALKLLPDFTYDQATGMLVIAYQTFVIQSEGFNILVDTCVGDHPEYPPGLQYDKQPWLDGLAELGLTFEDIDYVCCTHLHIDHVGWNTRLLDGRLVPTFPNAKYIFAEREYDEWAANGHAAVGRSLELCVTPVVEAGQALLIGDDFALSDDIRMVPTPGHSPGHMCLSLDAGDQHVLFSGDLMHHAIQCIEPDWSTMFCWRPLEAAAMRRKILSRYAGTDTLVVPAHFPVPSCGHVRAEGNSFRFDFLS